MTCPSLASAAAVPPDAAAQVQNEMPAAVPSPAPRRLARLAARLRQDDALAQLIRFALVGGTSTVFYVLIFLALHPLGYLPAHVTATIISSIVVNELHRRLTFHAGDRVSFLAAQWEAGTVSLIGLAATSAALGWLDATTTHTPAALQIALVLAVTTFIGIMRFIALRWIFRPQPAGGD